MGMTIGIRREDKNEWERRVPLTPAAIAYSAISEVFQQNPECFFRR